MKTNFDAQVNRLGTFCTQWDYIEDRFGQKDLLPFSVSDTDFKIPPEITTKLHQRLEHEIFGYTRWNHRSFKDSVIKWYQEQFKSEIDSQWLVYSPSVIYAISQLIAIKSVPGDNILIQTPAYDAFFKTINASGRHLLENPLIYQDMQYHLDFELLEKQLANPKTTILLLCSPHNPTGRVWKETELQTIIQLCHTYDVFIISDDIHMDVLRQGQKHIPLTQLSHNNLAICTSASKTFNIPGLIFSYVIIPDQAVQKAFLHNLKEKDGLSSTSILGMIATIEAYSNCQYWVTELNQYIDQNFELVETFLDERLPLIHLSDSQATYLAWLDISQLGHNSEDLQNALITVGKVAIMPGDIYGEAGTNFIRLNLGCSQKKLMEGLIRLEKAIKFLEKSSQMK